MTTLVTKRETPNTKHDMTTIWLARHAETAVPNVVHGAESDIDLGEHGHRQAEAVAPWFRDLRPTVVVSSAMRRAVRTAAPIAALCAVRHEIEPDLHERIVGPFSQKGGAEVDVVWAETVRQWEAGEVAYAYPGMESFARIRDRVCRPFNGSRTGTSVGESRSSRTGWCARCCC